MKVDGKFISLVAIIIMIFLFWWLMQPDHPYKEGFGEPVGRRLHVIVNRDGEPLNVSYQQPSGNGISGCTQVPCPDGYQDNLTCWCCCNFH